MTLFDDNSSGANTPPESTASFASPSFVTPPFSEVPPGDPFTYGAQHPQPYHFVETPVGDLQIPWSWGHLICFFLFSLVSLALVQLGFISYYMATKAVSTHPTQKELQHLATSKPVFIIGSTVLLYGLLFFFLYATLTFFYRSPFWQSLGWRKLSESSELSRKPWIYLAAGCTLSIVVMLVTSLIKTPEDTPIQELLKNPGSAIGFMAMAVLIAPLAEETLFRGYLYPVLVRIASAVLRFLGIESARSVRIGVVFSILLTGFAFGMLHAEQLGKNWKLVTPLITVGIVFTFVRARARSTFASFLMHLGYNSTLALLGTLAMIVAKYGKFPPHH